VGSRNIKFALSTDGMNPFGENRTIHSTWPVLVDCVAQVFYVLDPETGKHIVVFGKQKIVGVENVEDNDKDVNQFEEMPLFTNPMNIKHIEREFDKNLMPYMRKGGNEKVV
jgi:hypothetical protein